MPLPPVQSAQANNLIQMLARGGAPGGAPPGVPGGPPPGAPGAPGAVPPGGPPSPEAMQLGGAVDQLDGANPQGMADMLVSMNTDLAKAYLTSATRVPGAAPHISKARDSIGKAIQEIQKAAQVLGQIRPIANTAGVGPGLTPGGSQPDIAALLG